MSGGTTRFLTIGEVEAIHDEIVELCGVAMVMADWLKRTAEAPSGPAREAVIGLFEGWLRISVD